MIDAELPRVQHQSTWLHTLARRLGVDGVAYQGPVFVFHVDADLMRAASPQMAHYECGARGGIAEKHAVIRDRGTTGGRGDYGHFLTIARIATDVGEDRFRSGCGNVLRDAEVDLFIRATGKLRDEMLVRVVVFRHDQTAGCILVKPMHDAGPLHAADARELALAMMQKSIHESAVVIADGGMHDHAVLFIDDDDVLIFKQHLQGDCLRRGFCGDGLRNGDADAVTEFHRIAGLRGLVIAKNEMLTDEFLYARTREVRQTAGQPSIDAVCARLINREDHDKGRDRSPSGPAGLRVFAIR